jgi:REP element-mobilizing transposase RayT
MSKARMTRCVLAQELFGFAVPPHRRGPRRTKDSKVAHSSREEMKKTGVAHVTVKLKKGFRSLRRKDELAIIKAAIGRVNGGEDVRIIEFSVMSNHIHLIVEASNSADLSKGMASLNTGLGMRLNRLWGRVGVAILGGGFHSSP